MAKSRQIQSFFKPVSAKRNSEYIASQIEESIIAKVYEPNDRLPSERELATQFNVGRGAVREALRMLDASGFVEVRHGGDGGIYVKELDSTRMMKTMLDLVRIGNISTREITQVRIVIEKSIIESCFSSLREKEILELEKNIERCETLIKEGKPIFGEVQNFHVLLSSFCDNRLLRYILVSLVDISDSYIESIKKKVPGSPSPSDHIAQHKAILSAIKKKDLEDTKRLLIGHLTSISEAIKELLKANYGNDLDE